jgi:PPOX class probable F420-dependent enzyme
MTATEPIAPPSAISDAARRFLEAPRFAIVATLNPDGGPLQAVVWYALEGDAIVFNSCVGRQWPTNLARDRRVSFVVADAYDYLEIRGEVEIDEDQVRSQAVIAGLTRRYEKDEAAAAVQIDGFAQQQRVTFVLRPRRVYERLSAH